MIREWQIFILIYAAAISDAGFVAEIKCLLTDSPQDILIQI